MKGLAGEIGRFGGVGVLAAVAHYGTLIALVELLHITPTTASLAGFVAGGIVSYILNRSYTFRSGRAHSEALPRFLAIAAVGFVLTGVLMAGLTEWLAVPYILAQISTTGVVLVWHYIANKFITFKA